MKTKTLITAIGGVCFMLSGNANAVTSCLTCRDDFSSGCTIYSTECCEAICRKETCTIANCHGTTVVDMGGGCDKVETQGCVATTCKTTTSARCQKGYYGTATLNASNTSCSGCTPCPASGTTAETGATAITECYIPSGTTSSDTTGAFKYTENCYYK